VCLCIYEIRECGGALRPRLNRDVHLIKIPFHGDKRVTAPHVPYVPYRCYFLVLGLYHFFPAVKLNFNMRREHSTGHNPVILYKGRV